METYYKIINRATGEVIARNALLANTLWKRMRGLIGRRLEADGGLILPMGKSIHMIGMAYPIDVAFIDSNSFVIHEIHSIKPWRISRMVWKASAAIELPSGTLTRTGSKVGHQLGLERLKNPIDPP